MPAKKAEGQRIELAEGYVVMRPMTIDDLLAFDEADINIGPAIRAAKEGCVEFKFKNGQPLGAQPVATLKSILQKWNAMEDEVALPPASAQLSALPSTGR